VTRAPVSPRALLVAASVVVLALLAVLGFEGCANRAPSGPSGAGPVVSGTATPRSGLPTVPVAELPSQARTVLARIDRGGPFPYRQDGTVFNNFEGRLPKRAGGYYHEYTVPTPGSADRGARRLIVGRGGDVYYTSDHYDSFRQVIR